MEMDLMMLKAGLTPKQMLYMRDYIGGKTMKEIAMTHGITLPTVSRTIKAARAKMDRLEEYRITGGDQAWHGKI